MIGHLVFVFLALVISLAVFPNATTVFIFLGAYAILAVAHRRYYGYWPWVGVMAVVIMTVVLAGPAWAGHGNPEVEAWFNIATLLVFIIFILAVGFSLGRQGDAMRESEKRMDQVAQTWKEIADSAQRPNDLSKKNSVR